MIAKVITDVTAKAITINVIAKAITDIIVQAVTDVISKAMTINVIAKAITDIIA